MVKRYVLLFLLSMSTAYTGCWFSRSLEISEIPTKKTELLDIINEIQTRQANISSTYKRAKKLVKLLPIEVLNDALLAIVCTPLSEMYSSSYFECAHLALLKLAQRIVRKGGDIHYQADEVFIRAAKNFPKIFVYLLKRSEYFKTPYRLATFRAIAEQNRNFIYTHVVNVYIQQLSMPQWAEIEYIEHLAKQLVDNKVITPAFIQHIQERIRRDHPDEIELIADDLICAIIQERDIVQLSL